PIRARGRDALFGEDLYGFDLESHRRNYQTDRVDGQPANPDPVYQSQNDRREVRSGELPIPSNRDRHQRPKTGGVFSRPDHDSENGPGAPDSAERSARPAHGVSGVP